MVRKRSYQCRRLCTDSGSCVQVVPSDIGRIPHKIFSGFALFTADQFKNWIVYFSVIALWDILTPNDLECWRHFVLACRLLCSEKKKNQIRLADALLLQLCKRTERMYGKHITPNMHMHCHLKDYSIITGFWLLCLRISMVYLALPNNNCSIELQLTNRFIMDSAFLSTRLPQEFKEEFSSVMPDPHHSVGSIVESTSAESVLSDFMNWSSYTHQCNKAEVSLHITQKVCSSQVLNISLVRFHELEFIHTSVQ